jgi:hypothetical protein
MVEDVERLCQLRRIKLDIIENGTGKFRVEALLAWFADRPEGTGKALRRRRCVFPAYKLWIVQSVLLIA